MCSHVSPAKLNKEYGIKIVAIVIFSLRFILAGRIVERKIIRAGILTETSAANRKPCEISKTNTFPCMIPAIFLGIYNAK